MSKQYRKKPVVIEAELFDGTNGDAIAKWCGGTYHFLPYQGDHGESITHIRIDTLEGRMSASVGDYIIKGVQGEFYPCKPDIFLETYTPVTDLKPSDSDTNIKVTSESPTPPPTSEIDSKLDDILSPQIMNETVCPECNVDFEEAKEAITNLIAQEANKAEHQLLTELLSKSRFVIAVNDKDNVFRAVSTSVIEAKLKQTNDGGKDE